MSPLDQNSAIPLYKQLKEHILRDINAGLFSLGKKIPTENELSMKYDISRITVRNAIAELVKDGYLTKQQGKGTFINNPLINENILDDTSFTSVCLSNGLTPGSRILTVAMIDAGDFDVEQLMIPSTEKVLYIQRIRFANGSPVILEDNYFTQKFADLANENLENASIYKLLRSKFGIKSLHSQKTIEIAMTSKHESELLGTKRNAPVLLVHELVCDENDGPVHRTKLLIRGDTFKYIVK